MINGKSVLAIIPARGGSKGLPRKNILMLAGKPLIAWSIEAAKKSIFIDRCVVSTDDNEIAVVAKEFGADIPFIRPAALATDTANSNDVILHAIGALEENYDFVVLLQPTSPIRNYKIIDLGIKRFVQSEADSLVSVTVLEHPIEWSFPIENNKIPNQFIKEFQIGNRRQDYPQRYQLNGALYICEIKTFLTSHTFFMDSTFAFQMDNLSSLDIDTVVDIMTAESIIRCT